MSDLDAEHEPGNLGSRHGTCGHLAPSRPAQMRDPARHRRHHPRSGAVAAAGLGAAETAPHLGAARRLDRRRGGAGLGPFACRHRPDLLAPAACRDRRPWRGAARRGRRRAGHARGAAEHSFEAQARQRHRDRPRHPRREQGLLAGDSLSPGAGQGRRSARGGRGDLRRRAAGLGRNPARQTGGRDQAGRHQQGRRGVRADGLSAVRRPQSDLHRRRRHRRAGVRHHREIRRPGLFRRPHHCRHQRPFRQAGIRARLAGAHRGRSHGRGRMKDHGLDLAVIGNGRTAALVDPESRIVWWCYPRFDGDPIFCRLVSGKEEKGFSDVLLDDMAEYQSEYVRNTAIVSTVQTDRNGGKVKITDFAPRFLQFGRVFRPPQLFRIIEPIAGLPRITIRMRPTCDYGKPLPNRSLGSNHIRYSADSTVIRLTTDAPLSLIESEAPFVLTRPLHLVFGPDEPYSGDLQQTCREFAERTHDYWMEWVRRLSISYDWQEAIIRAAITLKLSNFDETGGIIAAHTTSIPEAPSSGRTWDYRYCWLRDAYFVVQALNRIGATRTMEEFISFTLSIASKLDHELRPVYSIVPTTIIAERTAPDLEGYRGDGPVRVGNAAVDQVQHDTYGSVILAAMPMFFDRRLPRPGDEGLFHLLESLGDRAARKALEPDAGIWEYRGRSRIHTHSAAMCWAGCQRLAAIANRIGLADRAKYWNSIAEPIHAALIDGAWNEKRGAFTAAFGSDDLDASVLLLADLGVVEVDDPRFASTVAAMERELMREKHVMRYANADDFGLPVTAFLICRFWLIDALWSLGRRDAAKDLFNDALNHRNRYGLLSEDVDPQTGALWGNFPQTYSMAGLILSAMRLSRSWEDRYWRG